LLLHQAKAAHERIAVKQAVGKFILVPPGRAPGCMAGL
jgi:hypothetical protein